MKKFVTMLAAVLLGTLISTAVSAAEWNPNVWVETTVGEDHTVSFNIITDGTATDGVVEITYDVSVVAIADENVKPAAPEVMYSVNAEDGSIKISFLGKDPIKEGSFMAIPFKTVKESAAEEEIKAAFSFTGYAYNGEEKEVAIEELQNGVPVVPGENNPPDGSDASDNNSDNDSNNNSDGNSGGGSGNSGPSASVSANQAGAAPAKAAATGDASGFPAPAVLIGLGCVLMAAGMRKRISH